ncbi:MAG: phosphate ABC transporter permease PstA [Candidatus Omnitrophica bacterium]|nr:phosphate ABC transporter permease PstA [Candidatus Omnitrophota bacterium]MBU4303586.1 phosphate ABC transporter permease PstA [Candidatus Omnitrophota bacterium]MBU4418743.1 phosphate ABC transporter permease PstA [Candidatus Omnitrophota bacterium]MBU4467716.1 phosphate ABC transporter permease PstA [Candidatus Omnitrophota bacterium]
MRLPQVEENIFKGLMIFSTLIVVSSLVLILATIFIKGFPALNLDMITKTPKGGYYLGKEGGVLNAILGSLILGIGATFLALLVSLPLVFYLNLYLKKNSKLALSVRFFLDVLWGIPSIVYGAFGFTLMIFFGLRASLLAGTITIALLIIPIMARSIDEVLKMIPFELKEASYALGATKLETAIKVIFRQALPGILTAILIAFGRGIGDAAAVLFTASFTDSLPYSLFKPVATLPLAIFFQLGTPFPEVQQRGYASALILTIIILGISILSRILSSKFNKHTIK